MTSLIRKKPTVGVLPVQPVKAINKPVVGVLPVQPVKAKKKPTVGVLPVDVKPVVIEQVEAIATKSKNSLVAISGNRAEDIICSSTSILETLGSTYFHKKIVSCQKIAGRKKSDLKIRFEDDSHVLAQLKNGTGGGRGWSFDRRQVDKLPTHDGIKSLLKSVCLKSGNERTTVENDKSLLTQLLLGEEEAMQPQYYIHTNVTDGVIVSLSICSTTEFMDAVLQSAYEHCQAKKTCVHLTPLIYLQRKGGGKADHSPSDIQAKLREMPPCMTTIL